MPLAHQEGQAEQQVEEHLEVQRPADVQRRVQAIATGVFGRDEQQRQEQVLPVEYLMWHPLAEGQQQHGHQQLCRTSRPGRCAGPG
jgi:macrodomain Ter protein organizer (MatP/YcbG family)